MNLFLTIIFILILMSCTSRQSEVETENNLEEVEETMIEEVDTIDYYKLFGVNVSGLKLQKGTLQKGENLTDILLEHNILYKNILKIAEKSKPVLDVKKFKKGKEYFLFYENDSLKTGRYFIYQNNPVVCFIFELTEPYNITEKKADVEIKVVNSSGIIDNSLYETMVNNGLPIILAIKLSDIFAWEIDFFHLQKGDQFKIVYEEEYVNNKFASVGRVKGAVFINSQKQYHAILYEDDEKEDYYDLEGNSLRKAFLKAPLKFSRISSKFSYNRFHPVLKKNKPHLGTDYAAPKGTPIMTVGDGIVVESGFKGGNGNYVKVKHNGLYSTAYLHMSKISKGIKKGIRVKQGQVIGNVGSTGLATGPHVCYRFYKSGKQIDPLKVELPPSEPIKKEFLSEFLKIKENILKELENPI